MRSDIYNKVLLKMRSDIYNKILLTIIAISLGTIAIGAVGGSLTVEVKNPQGWSPYGGKSAVPFRIAGNVDVDTSVVTVDASGWPVTVDGNVNVRGNLNCN